VHAPFRLALEAGGINADGIVARLCLAKTSSAVLDAPDSAKGFTEKTARLLVRLGRRFVAPVVLLHDREILAQCSVFDGETEL